MAFTLNEAVVKIRTEGLDTLERDLKRTDTSLKRLGRGSSVKGLNADVRNTTRSVKNLGETAGRVGNLLAVMPGRGTAGLSALTGGLGTATTAYLV